MIQYIKFIENMIFNDSLFIFIFLFFLISIIIKLKKNSENKKLKINKYYYINNPNYYFDCKDN